LGLGDRVSEYAAWPEDGFGNLPSCEDRSKRPHDFPIAATQRPADGTRQAARSRSEKIQVFYINLDQDVARLNFVQEQLRKVGFAARRISAVDGSKPLPSELARYFCSKHVMSAGALGCYASHIKAWQEITLQRLPHALVLEDDAILDPELGRILVDLLAALPRGWDLVHLCAEPDRAVRPVAKLTGDRTVVQYSRPPFGAAGYLISAAGAQKMLLAEEPRVWPIDTDTRRPWRFCLNVFGVTTAPIRQNRKMPSTIQRRGRKPRTRRRGLHAMYGNPIRSLESLVFNYRKLGPYWWWRCLIVNGLRKFAALLRPVRQRVVTLRHATSTGLGR
jgi:glycosyl transferase, family 25